MESLTEQTHERISFTPITEQIQNLVKEKKWDNGALIVFCPHTTCGLTINEGADPDVVKDMVNFFSTLIPQSKMFKHQEGNSDAHIKASILGSSLNIIIENGKLALGTWQTIYLFDGDGPRKRQIWVQFLK